MKDKSTVASSTDQISSLAESLKKAKPAESLQIAKELHRIVESIPSMLAS